MIDSPFLNENGLNMQAVFNLSQLPEDFHNALAEHFDLTDFSQLILFAHGGNRLWQAVQESPFADKEHPIDHFSLHIISSFLEQELQCRYQTIYPFGQPNIPLQALGKLAGWRHFTPFRLGMHPEFGSWFAYRSVALTDSNLTPSSPATDANPCDTCLEKPCITACPAQALSPESEDNGLEKCIRFRLKSDSVCQVNCLSRCACPVGKEHGYSPEQMHYNYSLSLQTIKTFKNLK